MSTPLSTSPLAGGGATGRERTLGQLVSDLSEQGARLVRAEIDLAKAELVAKTKSLGTGAGILAAAGVVALYLVNVVLALMIIVLDEWLPLWAAALIVAGLLLVVVLVLALVGIRVLKAGTPPAPTRAQENVQEDITAVKEAIR
ncbi:phage holin family protein [Cellulomonas endophytica]|uniref:phage holin family protein n=1 Tax=Cellulomonas endophytica TaxID=2494735 RepID=UPI00101045FB|nr:phage holin family protein [Cellulomonas endophytica]